MDEESRGDTSEQQSTATQSKVKRVLADYGLTDLGAELEARWTAVNSDRASLRQLATDLNQELLRTVMHNAGLHPLDGEVKNTYRLLIGDDVSPGKRTEARRHLEREGVNVDQLETDFVSRQAIHTYLTKVRGVTNQPSDKDPVANAETYLRHLKQRTATITDSRLTQLHDTGHLSMGSPRVLVDIQVLCEDCGQQYSLEDLFAAGSCACKATDDP